MYENFEQVTLKKGGTHFHARCLLCGDSKKSRSKKRFHLDWKDGDPVWQCWNCGKSGKFMRLFCYIKGVSFDEAKKMLHKYDSATLKKTLSRRNQTQGNDKIEHSQVAFNWILDDCVDENILPDYSVFAPRWLKILKDFRVDREIPNNIKFYYAYKGKYKDRIIIPIFDKYNDIMYFQARRLPGSEIEPKYKNPKSGKSLIIFNENMFRNDLYIIVAEGLIDAFTVGNQGTTCLGKNISDEFLDKLFKFTNKGIIIVFDNDNPGRESLFNFMKENRYAKKVKYFNMPKDICNCKKLCKDINKFSTKHKIGDVYDFIVNNSYTFTKTFVSLKVGG